jgi:hypothetical protein
VHQSTAAQNPDSWETVNSFDLAYAASLASQYHLNITMHIVRVNVRFPVPDPCGRTCLAQGWRYCCIQLFRLTELTRLGIHVGLVIITKWVALSWQQQQCRDITYRLPLLQPLRKHFVSDDAGVLQTCSVELDSHGCANIQEVTPSTW